MIISNIIGGLGNQMFQYASARALSIDLNQTLKVTQDMFGIYNSHYGAELERVFNLKLNVAQPAELKKVIGPLRTKPEVRRALASKHLAPLRGKSFIVEPHYHYWQGLQDRVRQGGYLQGYWQSERYFSTHATKLRREFTFRPALTGRNAETARMILDGAAVSVHVRRGDYISNAKTLSMHGTCSPEYYFAAIDAMLERVPQARLFAFSDDPQWVAEVLAPRYPSLVLVDHNRGEHSYNDMHLMSLCRHHIIANSSFSWWGAWLNPNPDKMVIAPRQWFANGTDAKDLLPPTWERM